MRTENLILLIGHVGHDPEVRAIQGKGDLIATFSVATNRGQREDVRTDWHRVKCFGMSAKFVEGHIRKGSLVYIRGRMEYYEYEKDGRKLKSAEISAHSVTLLSGSPRRDGQEDAGPTTDGASDLEDPDQDVPF